MKRICFALLFLLLANIGYCADTKTTALTELTDVDDADIMYIVDDVAGTPTSKKITVINLFDTIDTSFKLITIVTDESGTGALVFGTAPTFTTSITTPLIYGSAASGGDLLLHSTSNGTKGLVAFGSLTTGLMYDEVNNRTSIGDLETTIDVNGTEKDSPFTVHSEAGVNGITSLFERHTTLDARGVRIYVARSKGDEATHLPVDDGSVLLEFCGLGFDGTDYGFAGCMRMGVDGDPSDGTDMPGYISLSTSPDGTAVPVDRLIIDNAGNVNITGLTASEILATDASKNLVSLAVATYPSLAELIHVKGVTSAIQTQIDGKEGTLTNSAGLAGALSDEIGTGLACFATAPVFTTSATVGNGGTLQVNSAGDDKNVQITHDDTDAKIESSSGDIILIPAGGDVQLPNILTVGATLDITADDGSIDFSSDKSWMRYHDDGTLMFHLFANRDIDEFQFVTVDGGGNQIVITSEAGRDKDHDHATTTNPTVFIHSDVNPDVSNNQWGSFHHDQENFIITTGDNTGVGSAPTTDENAVVIAPRGAETVRFPGADGMTMTGDVNNCFIYVDDDATCDSGTAMVVDNSIAVCAVCAAN